MTYAEWIADYEQALLRQVRLLGAEELTEAERIAIVVRGTCREATEAMVKAFPELRRVRGHYSWCPHWWCETPDGTVVDPTARQFTSGGVYVEYTGPEPLGKCMNCGDYVWTALPNGDTSACSDECLKELEVYYS